MGDDWEYVAGAFTGEGMEDSPPVAHVGYGDGDDAPGHERRYLLRPVLA